VIVQVQVPEAKVGVPAKHFVMFQVFSGGNGSGGGSGAGSVELTKVTETSIALKVDYAATISGKSYQLKATSRPSAVPEPTQTNRGPDSEAYEAVWCGRMSEDTMKPLDLLRPLTLTLALAMLASCGRSPLPGGEAAGADLGVADQGADLAPKPDTFVPVPDSGAADIGPCTTGCVPTCKLLAGCNLFPGGPQACLSACPSFTPETKQCLDGLVCVANPDCAAAKQCVLAPPALPDLRVDQRRHQGQRTHGGLQLRGLQRRQGHRAAALHDRAVLGHSQARGQGRLVDDDPPWAACRRLRSRQRAAE
jgi:hypothetical protein